MTVPVFPCFCPYWNPPKILPNTRCDAASPLLLPQQADKVDKETKRLSTFETDLLLKQHTLCFSLMASLQCVWKSCFCSNRIVMFVFVAVWCLSLLICVTSPFVCCRRSKRGRRQRRTNRWKLMRYELTPHPSSWWREHRYTRWAWGETPSVMCKHVCANKFFKTYSKMLKIQRSIAFSTGKLCIW